jgi:hypothetical protein
MNGNRLFLYAGLLFAAIACFAQKNSSYTVFDVPGATSTYPVSINNGGDIAGWFCSTSCGGFVRELNGKITTFDGTPTGINDAGAVVGYTSGDDGYIHPFLRDPKGNIMIFDVPQPSPPAFPLGIAVGINNKGDIAGYIIPQPLADTWEGFVRNRQGDITTFSIPLGAQPTAVNGRGDITGHTSEYYPAGDGFVRERSGNITVFDVPDAANCSGSHAYPVSINNRGDVAGYYSFGEACTVRGFVRSRKGTFTVFDLPSVGTLVGAVASINEKGDVLGSNFLRSHTGTVTTFDGPTSCTLSRGVSLNDRDDVAGACYGYDPQTATWVTRGFVRTER